MDRIAHLGQPGVNPKIGSGRSGKDSEGLGSAEHEPTDLLQIGLKVEGPVQGDSQAESGIVQTPRQLAGEGGVDNLQERSPAIQALTAADSQSWNQPLLLEDHQAESLQIELQANGQTITDQIFAAAHGTTPSAPSTTTGVSTTNTAVSEVSNHSSTLTADGSVQTRQAAKAAVKQTPEQPGSTPAQRLGLFRRLGHAFLSVLTPDPMSEFRKELEQVDSLETVAQELKTPEDFQAKTSDFKARLAAGASLEELRPEAYAVAREASRQALGMRAYECQVLGALAMDDGRIAEMKTGEGKTLAAVMPLYLNALMGQGAHLITVNDTLATRDAEEMGPVFERLGLSVGVVTETMTTEEKRAGYGADITYTTDRALGFDYLRDRTARSPSQRVQREPFFALIDEVDEVLLDEARTPLILSGTGSDNSQEYQFFNRVVKDLEIGTDILIDQEKQQAWLTDTGYERVETKLQAMHLTELLEGGGDPEEQERIQGDLDLCQQYFQTLTAEQEAFANLRAAERAKPGWLSRMRGAEWDQEGLEAARALYAEAKAQRLEQAETVPRFGLFTEENEHRVGFLDACVKAHALFQQGKDYLVSGDAVEIVDANKGRTSEGRRYNDGVHQALEAKEGVTVRRDQKITASITYPNLFKRYPRLAGMSGTAKTSEAELVNLYGLEVVPVPTNRPVIRKDEDDLVFATLEDKYQALAQEVAEDYQAGRPVMIGTLSVEHNVYVAKKLVEAGVPREVIQVLNAETVRGDKRLENQAISQAGRSGVVTVATNLAGRGANIKPDLVNFKELAEAVAEAQHQGRPVLVCLEKKAEAEWLQGWLAGMETSISQAGGEIPTTFSPVQIQYGEEAGTPLPGTLAEDTLVLRGQDFPTGGLTVYGTERSSSRRIDDQLIGRAGRQGAPGRSQFFLSLEDDLLRVFAASDLPKGQQLLTTPGVGVSDAGLTKLVAQAQFRVESKSFEARETTSEQDEVMNLQRQAFDGLRDEIVEGGLSLRSRFSDMVGKGLAGAVFDGLPEGKNSFSYEQIGEALAKAQEELGLPISLAFLDSEAANPKQQRMPAEALEQELFDWADRRVTNSMREMEQTLPNAEQVVRTVLLDVLDEGWSEHLEKMEALKQSVHWHALAEKDPEVEFKLQGYDLFAESFSGMNRQMARRGLGDLLAYLSVFQGGEPSTAKANGRVEVVPLP